MFNKILFVALVALAVGPAYAQPKTPASQDPVVRVMTLNMFEGAILDQIVMSPPGGLELAVANTWDAFVKSRPMDRVAAMARKINDLKPDLIALQEASSWKRTIGQKTEEVDLLEKLKSQLSDYKEVTRFVGLDRQLPAGRGVSVSLSRRTAILARSREIAAKAGDLKGPFKTLLEIPLHVPGPGGAVITIDVPIVRGWISADVTKSGRSFRFVTTHLEFDEVDQFAKQFAQGAELAKILSEYPKLPIVLAGDFNSDAEGAGWMHKTYALLTDRGAGFVDAWKQFRPKEPGYTCCHKKLEEPDPRLTQRIDLVLYRGDFVVKDAQLVLDKWADRGRSAMWPSDHVGVMVALEIPGPDRKKLAATEPEKAGLPAKAPPTEPARPKHGGQPAPQATKVPAKGTVTFNVHGIEIVGRAQ